MVKVVNEEASRMEKDKLVAEVVRYVLFKTEQSSGCPIKREELTQLITGKNYRQRNLPAFVINEAKSKLSSIFGFEVSRGINHGDIGGVSWDFVLLAESLQFSPVAADAKSYILRSQLPADVYTACVEDKKKSHVTALAFVVTSIVRLAGGKINEENLWPHLRRLGLSETDESHPVHGNVKLALEAIVQQRYLHKEKVNGPEGNATFYELAERALDGPVDDGMKQHISKIVNKDIASVDTD
ncbi:General regulatory factor 11, OMICRON,RHS5 [Capsicum annuum]|nr:General regulatory factor 11, OMICRON,RHS5 [Capsicum annuum]